MENQRRQTSCGSEYNPKWHRDKDYLVIDAKSGAPVFTQYYETIQGAFDGIRKLFFIFWKKLSAQVLAKADNVASELTDGKEVLPEVDSRSENFRRKTTLLRKKKMETFAKYKERVRRGIIKPRS